MRTPRHVAPWLVGAWLCVALVACSAERVCVPGASIACARPECTGAQTCNADGTALGECICPEPDAGPGPRDAGADAATPTCTGSAAPCSSRTPDTCNAVLGCELGTCVNGTLPRGCGDRFTRAECEALTGCFWESDRCGGSSRPCSAFEQQAACEAERCHWSTVDDDAVCRGTAVDCHALDEGSCASQPGCIASPHDAGALDATAPLDAGVSEPTHLWSRRLGLSPDASDGNTAVVGMMVDGAGNVTIVGRMQGQADFGGGILGTAFLLSVFVVSYDADGRHRWSEAFSATGGCGIYAAGVSGDDAEVHFAGHFCGEATIGAETRGAFDVVTTYLVALDAASGAVRRLRTYTATSGGAPVIHIATAAGRTYVGGYVNGSADLGEGSVTSMGEDVFSLVHDATGTRVATRIFVAPGSASPTIGTATAAGPFMVGGGDPALGGPPIVADLFHAALAPDLTHRWSGPFASGGQVQPVAISVRGAALAVGGAFFDRPGETTTIGGRAIASAGEYDAFVATFDATTGALRELFRIGGPDRDVAGGMALDASGYVVLSGTHSAGTDLGDGPTSDAGAFLVSRHQDGTHRWSYLFDPCDPIHVAIGPDDSIYVAGWLGGPTSLGGDVLTPTTGRGDGFVMRVAQP